MLAKSFAVFTIAIFSGGAIFMNLEHGEARKTLSPQQEIAFAKGRIFMHSNMSRNEIDEIFKNIEKAIRQNGVKEPYKWNYYESCFFVGSLLTTIGYGHIAPKTIGGQLFAIFYSFFGIPLTVLVVRKLSNKIIDIVLQIVKLICTTRSYVETTRGGGFKEYVSYQNGTQNILKLGMNQRTSRKQKGNRFSSSSRQTKILCIIVLFIMVVLFLMISSVIRVVSEGWTMQQSIYFWFTTLTTVGFGDFVPYDGREPPSLAATIIYYSGTFYLMFGLALIASLVQCISVIFEGRLPTVTTENIRKASHDETETQRRCHFLHSETDRCPMPNQPNVVKLMHANECEADLPHETNTTNTVFCSSSQVLKICIPERCIANLSASIDIEGLES